MMPFPSLAGSQLGFVAIISAVRTLSSRTFCGKDHTYYLRVIFSEWAGRGIIISCIELAMVTRKKHFIDWIQLRVHHANKHGGVLTLHSSIA
jgi:hypothetical protein